MKQNESLNKMTDKCDAMVEATSTATLPAPESCNQATEGEDPSVKTIEFLRARLLSERAASKAAREQAQQTANKVKDLQAQIEREIKQRKEAETSISTIFAILKAKGLAVAGGGVALALHETGLTKLGVIKEVVEEPATDKQEVSGLKAEPPTVHIEQVPLVKDERLVERRVSAEPSKIGGMCNQRELGIEEADVHGNMEYAYKCPGDLSDTLMSEGNFSIDQHRSHVEEDEVKYAVISKPTGMADHSSSNCALDTDKDTSPVTDSRLAMTHNLKEKLLLMEEEVHALPMDQRLKAELQHLVDRVMAALDNGKDMSVQGRPGPRGNVNKVGEFNRPREGVIELDTSSCVQLHDKEVDAREESTIPPVYNERLMPGNLDRLSCSFNGEDYHMENPPFYPLQHSATLHSRRQSSDSFNTISFGLQNMPSMPWLEQSGNTSSAYPSLSGHCTYSQATRADWPYFIEAESPNISVGPSSTKVPNDQGQLFDGSSLGRISSFRSQATFDDETLPCPISSANFGQNAINNLCISKQDHHFGHVNVKGYTSRLPNGHLNDAMLSLVDEKHGRLGQVLTTLDVVRQRVNGEDPFVASVPMATLQADPRITRGGEGARQPWPGDQYTSSHPHRSRAYSQISPIVQFPPSPSSEYAYSPFQRHERHRRSSSVAADFMRSAGWDGYPHQFARGGEVQLGNGITLYTD